MAMQEVEFDGDPWVLRLAQFPRGGTRRGEPQVDVSTAGSSSWVSLTGHAVVVDDLDRKRRLWNAVVETWFPDGPEDPDVVLLRIDAASAAYRDSPGGRLVSVLSFAKAKLTGQPHDGGENERVQL